MSVSHVSSWEYSIRSGAVDSFRDITSPRDDDASSLPPPTPARRRDGEHIDDEYDDDDKDGNLYGRDNNE